MIETCDFCKKVVGNTPVRDGEKVYCNHLCEAGDSNVKEKTKAPT